jgi:uncharacterized protein YgbK (DUF1537 family)
MIVVIADDLTGAAELAGAALQHGLSAEVQTVFEASSPAEVVCVDTDSRLLPPGQAAERVAVTARNVAAAKPEWVFKKCDSVLRGPVLPEARATADAVGRKHILILPANPTRQRVIRAGQYFIEGRPLHETVFAHDPAHPRTTAIVTALLGDDLTGVETPDAETDSDIARLAASTDRATLPVGAADYFTALLRVRVGSSKSVSSNTAANPPGRALLVCGSAASWPQRQAEANAHGIPIFARPYQLTDAAPSLQVPDRALLGIGAGSGLSSAILSAELANAAATLAGQIGFGSLLLEGGATARAVVNRLGWTRLQACQGSAQGVGILRPVGAAGPLLFIKPGSYPWPPTVWPGRP